MMPKKKVTKIKGTVSRVIYTKLFHYLVQKSKLF